MSSVVFFFQWFHQKLLMIPLTRKNMKLGSFLKVKMHLTAAGCIQDVSVAQHCSTAEMLPLGLILHTVQTQAVPQKASQRVSAARKMRMEGSSSLYFYYSQRWNTLCLAHCEIQMQTLTQSGAGHIWRGTQHCVFPLALEMLKAPWSFKASSIFSVDYQTSVPRYLEIQNVQSAGIPSSSSHCQHQRSSPVFIAMLLCCTPVSARTIPWGALLFKPQLTDTIVLCMGDTLKTKHRAVGQGVLFQQCYFLQ